MGLLAVGFGLGLALAFYRNLPPAAVQAFPVVVVAWIASIAAAYFGGRRFVQQQWQLQIQEQEQNQEQEQIQTQQQAVVVYVGEGGHAAAQAVVGPPRTAQLETATSRQGADSSSHELREGQSSASDHASHTQGIGLGTPSVRHPETGRLCEVDTDAPGPGRITATDRDSSRPAHLLEGYGGFANVDEPEEVPRLDALHDVPVVAVSGHDVVDPLQAPSAVTCEPDRDDSGCAVCVDACAHSFHLPDRSGARPPDLTATHHGPAEGQGQRPRSGSGSFCADRLEVGVSEKVSEP